MVVSLKNRRKMNHKGGAKRGNSRRPNFSAAEIEAIVTFMEARKDLEYGEMGGRAALSADVRTAWEEVTAAVNGVNGALKINRTASEVKDKWMCFKYRTKKKAQAIMAKRLEASAAGRSASVGAWEVLNPLEERVVELIGRDVVYCSPGESPTETQPQFRAPPSGARRGGIRQKQVIKRVPHLPNGQVTIKNELKSESSDTEAVHSIRQVDLSIPLPVEALAASGRCPSPSTHGLLRTLMDQHQLMLESLTNFQESLDTHNKIQRGILCMKYMKLKLLAEERNVEVVLPPELESLMAATNDD